MLDDQFPRTYAHSKNLALIRSVNANFLRLAYYQDLKTQIRFNSLNVEKSRLLSALNLYRESTYKINYVHRIV